MIPYSERRCVSTPRMPVHSETSQSNATKGICRVSAEAGITQPTTVIHRSVIQSTVIGFCRQQFIVDWLWVFLRLTICSFGMHMNILGGVGGLCTPGYTVSDDALENRLLDTPVTVCDCAKFG